MSALRILFLMGLAAAGVTACGGNSSSTSSDGGSGGDTPAGGSGGTGGGTSAGGAGGAGGGGVTAKCTGPTPITCEDQILLDMNLQPVPAPGLIDSQSVEGGWESHVDATAGGAFASTPDSYVYAKFGSGGLTKVDISDEASLESMDWDIAFRRYIVRINSGDSGPSCVEAARIPGDVKFEDVTAVPDTVTYHPDDYFTESCAFIPDGSGLENSPATALSAYWTYPGCVQMNDYLFVIALADGHHVKFIVDSYYEPTAQEQCDTTGAVPMGDTGSANFIVRWAYLD
jgi:hypothetical protein